MAETKRPVIAIDGPAGSGKSTVAKLVASRLGYLYIDTGAMYRALTLKAIRAGVRLEDGEALARLAHDTAIGLGSADGTLTVSLDGEDVTGAIRTQELTNQVKFVARVPCVRARMVELQRAMADGRGAVLEGRDIGTVVFPGARFKFYLDADIGTRTARRRKDLAALGHEMSLDEVAKDVAARDASDMDRSVGALKKADDAVVIDTTHLSVEEVARKVLSHIQSSGGGQPAGSP